MQHLDKLVILGRDGILNEYRDDHVRAPEEWQPIPGALEAVSRLNHGGWHTVVATNQSGIGRGMIDMAAVNAVHAHMNRELAKAGGRIDAVFFCPHSPEDGCDCRKPLPGLMQEVGRRYAIDLALVPMAADTLRDLQAAQAAGCEPHLILSGRAALLDSGQRAQWLEQVPRTMVHQSLAHFADHLLRRSQAVMSAHAALT